MGNGSLMLGNTVSQTTQHGNSHINFGDVVVANGKRNGKCDFGLEEEGKCGVQSGKWKMDN